MNRLMALRQARALLGLLFSYVVLLGGCSRPDLAAITQKPSDATPGATVTSKQELNKPVDDETGVFRKDLFEAAFRQAIRFETAAPKKNAELRVELKVLEPAVEDPHEKVVYRLLLFVADAQDAICALEACRNISEGVTGGLEQILAQSDEIAKGYELMRRRDPARAEAIKQQIDEAKKIPAEVAGQWSQGNAILKSLAKDSEHDATLTAKRFGLECIEGDYGTYTPYAKGKKKLTGIIDGTLKVIGEMINNGGRLKQSSREELPDGLPQLD